ncbi:MAG: hypothetical protein LLF96_05635 [Eubacteriales bacterium]|nr:hypothetical protein [Eubacteriales bacterium]
MEFGEKVYKHSYRLWKDFIYHYCTYIELYNNFDLLKGDVEFWVYTTDAHFQMAIIRWCMIFGSDSNDTHWENLQLDKDKFKKRLLLELQITPEEWQRYWESMKDFRDKFVAHRSIEAIPSAPFFIIALKAVLCLENWVREELQTNTFEEKNKVIFYINSTRPLSEIMESSKKAIKNTILLLVDDNKKRKSILAGSMTKPKNKTL